MKSTFWMTAQETETELKSRQLADIFLNCRNEGSFFGHATPYSYRPELRKVLDGIYESAMRSDNRFFVLEGTIVRAAQSTKNGALAYMRDGLVLVEVRPDSLYELD